jgi:HAD superfamily hydrolase (TIGR01509 family)
MIHLREADLTGVEVLLCDADGNLFPSEEPAFDASTEVTNRLMESLGVARRYTARELRLATTGKNFRITAVDLAAELGVGMDAATLERWVQEEKRRVTTHLGAALRPDDEVTEPLAALGRRFGLAAVSSSAAGRLDVCFAATGLATLFPAEVRFSAEDSLPVPTSKPDPAIYEFAGRALAISTRHGLAIEDAVPGVQSAVAAGFQTVGNVAFVPPTERAGRVEALAAAGAIAVIASWRELEALLVGRALKTASADALC